MKTYILDKSTLETSINLDKQHIKSVTQQIRRRERVLNSKKEIYDPRLLADSYNDKLRKRAKELSMNDKVKLEAKSSFVRVRSESEPWHYTLIVNHIVAAHFFADLHTIEQILDKIVEELDDVVNSVNTGVKLIETNVHRIVGYTTKK